MNSPTKSLGNYGEEMVAKKMQCDGYTIIARNFRTRLGEIDIIAQYGDTIAFVEVKTRKRVLFDISEVITVTKQKKMIATANIFLVQNTRYNNCTGRFDVAIFEDRYKQPIITYIENAFNSNE